MLSCVSICSLHPSLRLKSYPTDRQTHGQPAGKHIRDGYENCISDMLFTGVTRSLIDVYQRNKWHEPSISVIVPHVYSSSFVAIATKVAGRSDKKLITCIFLLPCFLSLPWTPFKIAGSRFPANLCPLPFELSYHNLCSRSRIRRDACLITNTATKTQYLYSYEYS